MQKGDYLDVLLRSPKTVFSTKDISLLWKESAGVNTRARLHYALSHGKLVHLRRGLYAKDKNYSPYELAVKINTPAYISFETVLAKAGVIFQFYNTIFVASYLSKIVNCDRYQFTFRKIKSVVLTNPLGIEHENEYAIANTERALLDTLYLNKNYHFDNLSVINWDNVFDLLKIYDNKRLQNEVKKLYKHAIKNNL